MWVVGILIVLTLGADLSVAIGWNARAVPDRRLWNAPGFSGMFKDISGTLAGFSITSATFIASTSQNRDSPSYAAAVGLLLISFLILMSTAMMYGSTPTDPKPETASTVVFQSLTNVLVNAAYLLGVAVGWLALRPLLVLIGLQSLADVFTWLLLVTALAGSARLAGLTYRLTPANKQSCLLIPVIGFGLPALYWLVAARMWPELWPGTSAALYAAFLAFAVAAVALALQMGLLLLHNNLTWDRQLARHGHRIALALGQAAVLVIGMGWFAVATT